MNKFILALVQVGPFVSLAVVYAIRLALSYRALPEKIATHFDLRNTPNGWMTPAMWAFTSVATWVVLTIVFAGIYGIYNFGAQPQVIPALIILYMSGGIVSAAFNQIITIANCDGRLRVSGFLLYGIAGFTYGCIMPVFTRWMVRSGA